MGHENFFSVALVAIMVATGLSASWVVADESIQKSETESVSVRLYLVEGDLPMDDPNAASWNLIQPSQFKLAPQVHWPDRIQEVTVKSVKVRGMHNGRDVAIMVEYRDSTEDAADAAALEFMVGDKKAHFAHGQEMLQVEGGPVNIWYWQKKNGTALDMSAKGFKTLRAQEQQDVSATGMWQEGTWRVVFSRPLQTGDEHDVQINPGEWRNVAFAFWDGQLVDGAEKEQGSQKAISSWWYVRAEPPPDNSIYGYVVLGIVIAAGFEFFLVKKIRKGNQA